MKICVGLSGGVDSSVAALLLKRQGCDVFAMYMQNWHDIEGTLHGECEWEEEKYVAEMVARKIGIPFYFVDLSKEYMARVADYMFSEYSKGRTPNPDVLCNREIKFDAFLKAAERLGADAVATGHYCRRETLPDGTFRLLSGLDDNKDQSYFLCQLTQEQLSKAMFPIGEIAKPEVRRIAREADLPSAEKKDSQGICFVGKVDLPVFLQQKLQSVEGDIVEVFPKFYEDHPHPSAAFAGSLANAPFDASALSDEALLALSTPFDYSSIAFETETYRSGKKHIKKTRFKANPYGAIVGRHCGAQFYTLGQRKGLGVGGHADPLFVIGTDIDANRIYVGEGEAHPGLFQRALRIAAPDVRWIRPADEPSAASAGPSFDFVGPSASGRPSSVPSATPLGPGISEGYSLRVRVRIRYRQPLQDATLVYRPYLVCPSADPACSSRPCPDQACSPRQCPDPACSTNPCPDPTCGTHPVPGTLFIVFDEPQRSITPGQFAAWYAADGSAAPALLGSGVIA